MPGDLRRKHRQQHPCILESFTVELANGRTVGHHLGYICSCTVPHPLLASTDDELLDVPPFTDRAAEEVIVAELSAAETVREPWQSTHIRRSPDRFDFDFGQVHLGERKCSNHRNLTV